MDDHLGYIKKNLKRTLVLLGYLFIYSIIGWVFYLLFMGHIGYQLMLLFWQNLTN
jgi:hypothetical protein